jgi:hypothetical protein
MLLLLFGLLCVASKKLTESCYIEFSILNSFKLGTAPCLVVSADVCCFTSRLKCLTLNMAIHFADHWRLRLMPQIMAEVMGAEAALVRIQFVSGTHAIATALFAVLRPGDTLLAVAGKPYDTLEEVHPPLPCINHFMTSIPHPQNFIPPRFQKNSVQMLCNILRMTQKAVSLFSKCLTAARYNHLMIVDTVLNVSDR